MPDRLLPPVAVAVAALKEMLLVALGVVAALLAVEPALLGLFGLTTLIDMATVGFHQGRRVRYRQVPGRLISGPLSRFGQAVVVLAVSVLFANYFSLLRFLADLAVGYVAWRAAASALDHVLPADNEFRQIWDGVWRRIERTLTPPDLAEASPAPQPSEAEPREGPDAGGPDAEGAP